MRLDLLADRPDLFDVGGLARALRGTLGIESGLPKYAAKPSGLTVTVDKSLGDKSSYRPFIACAVMTLPPVDETSLIAIMKLQENLHWGVGRDRKLASIGVYDMATITGDITYRTIDPDKEPFVPLGMPGKKMSGRQILESHPKGMAYAELLADHKRYPVLVDAKDQVLSMPPIINSDETKLKKGTTRVFIDVTGISQAAVTKSLDTLVCRWRKSAARSKRSRSSTPTARSVRRRILMPRSTEIDLAEAKRWLGLAARRKVAGRVAAEDAVRRSSSREPKRKEQAESQRPDFTVSVSTPPTAPTSGTWSICSKTWRSATATGTSSRGWCDR